MEKGYAIIMIKIGDFAKLCGTNTQTIRFYDAEGVLKADYTDENSGYRYYEPSSVEKYKKIVFYKTLGFSLDEIKRLETLSGDEAESMLLSKRRELLSSVDAIKSNVTVIESLFGENTRSNAQPSDVPFEDDPSVVGRWRLCGFIDDESNISDPRPIKTPPEAIANIVLMAGGALAWNWFWTKGILYRVSAAYSFAIPNPYKLTVREGKRYMLLWYSSNTCIEKREPPIVLLYEQSDTRAYSENEIKRTDYIDIPSVADNDVIGEWQVRDFVPNGVEFSPNSQCTPLECCVTLAFRFAPRFICVKTTKVKDREYNHMLKYTKGFVINENKKTAEAYEIKEIDGKKYLFVEHKSGDYLYGGAKPSRYVFVKEK